MEKLIGIDTESGIIAGRDAIFLSSIDFRNETEVTLTGEVNSDKGYAFKMNFKGIVFFSVVELDFDEWNPWESLAVIENSEKLKRFRKADDSSKIKEAHQHYYIRSYDSVFEIISDRFTLEIENKP